MTFAPSFSSLTGHLPLRKGNSRGSSNQTKEQKKVTRGKSKASRRKARQPYPQEIKDKAVKLYKNGTSAAEICERLNIADSSIIYHWMRNAGVKANRNRKNAKPNAPRKRQSRKPVNKHHARAVQIFNKAMDSFNGEINKCVKRSDYEGVALFGAFGRQCKSILDELTGANE